MSAILITIGDRTFTAQLADNPTARDLVDQLPLTLRFRDFNRVEKIAELPRPLTMDGVPAGDDPEINNIGYYAPRAISFSLLRRCRLLRRDRPDRRLDMAASTPGT